MKVICNSIGMHQECRYCGGSKPHYKDSCEPCPFIDNAKCIDIDLNGLKALTWKEPFASLMLHGKIETRVWNTNYRGWVLICASKQSYYTEQLKGISGNYQLIRMGEFLPVKDTNYNGKAIAIGSLMDCRPMTRDDEDKCFVKYYPDLFCHIYENVLPIKPFPWKGKQGWSNVPDEIINKIEFI